jgi:hypothetical protein
MNTNIYGSRNRLTIVDLQRKMNEKNEKKSICYEKVLDICQKRIVTLTERDKTSFIFTFPDYVIGYPLFDLNSCMEYCKKNLISNGFYIEYYFPNKFYISWDFEEIKTKKAEQRRNIPLSSLSTIALKQPFNNLTKVNQSKIQNSNSVPEVQQMQNIPYNQNTNNNVNIIASKQPILPEHLQTKITSPLPLTPPKYNPFDVMVMDNNHINIDKNNNTNTNANISSHKLNNTFFPKIQQSDVNLKPEHFDNTFFDNNLKQMLTSGIGSSKSLFDYKPTGKLTLNL